MTVTVAVSGVEKSYGVVKALRNVSFDLGPGRLIALVGHNGAGKTTLIKLMLGLIHADRGAVRVLNEDPAAGEFSARRQLGYLPENVAFNAALTGRETLAFYARLKQIKAASAWTLLDRVGLMDAADRRDHVVDAFQRCGGKLWVRKVAIKPGKPLVLGKMADATYIGLPGNPGALFTTFKVIVDQILAVRAGIRPGGDSECAAIANFDWEGRPGRTTYLPAILSGVENGLPLVELLPDANSGKLHQLSRAGGFVAIAPEMKSIERGAQIRWRPFVR